MVVDHVGVRVVLLVCRFREVWSCCIRSSWLTYHNCFNQSYSRISIVTLHHLAETLTQRRGSHVAFLNPECEQLISSCVLACEALVQTAQNVFQNSLWRVIAETVCSSLFYRPCMTPSLPWWWGLAVAPSPQHGPCKNFTSWPLISRFIITVHCSAPQTPA